VTISAKKDLTLNADGSVIINANKTSGSIKLAAHEVDVG